MPTTTFDAGDVVNHTLIANKKMNLYKNDLKTVVGTANKGDSLGTVYSWIGGKNGADLYWQILSSTTPGGAYYVKHEVGAFNIPALGKELIIDGKKSLEEQAKDALEEQKKKDEGIVSYYIEKYGKWIVIAVGAAIALPSVVSSLKQMRTKKIAGMNPEQQKQGAVLVAAAVAVYVFTTNKK